MAPKEVSRVDIYFCCEQNEGIDDVQSREQDKGSSSSTSMANLDNAFETLLITNVAPSISGVFPDGRHQDTVEELAKVYSVKVLLNF